MSQIDLPALRVFHEIFSTGSLSRSAQRLGVTQPAISISLGKLRRHFNDPLFVRVGNGMVPTPQAVAMHEKVLAAIAAMESALTFRVEFDAATTDRVFRIAMTDVGQIVLLPELLDRLAVSAPRAQVEVSNITDRTPQLLESGDVDLVLGFTPNFPSGFYQQALFRERFACLCRADHPRISRAPTLEQFQAERHVLVVTSGTGHLIVDRRIELLELRREVAVRIPSFLGLATVIGHNDYLCTLPQRAADIMAQTGKVCAWDVPFDLPEYVVHQHWHERQLRDPGSRWLRELISAMFLDH